MKKLAHVLLVFSLLFTPVVSMQGCSLIDKFRVADTTQGKADQILLAYDIASARALDYAKLSSTDPKVALRIADIIARTADPAADAHLAIEQTGEVNAALLSVIQSAIEDLQKLVKKGAN
jgi:hypothetical protein